MKSEEAVKYLAPLFEGATEEMLYLLMLDKNYRAIDCMLLSKGVSNKVMTDAGRITLELLSKRAAAAIMAHNHPVGLPTPSSGDVSATKIIESSLTKLGIVFMDHLIFSTNRCYSMRKNNFISPSEW